MMKITFFALLLLSMSGSALAQVPVLISSTNPIINDWHINHNTDSFDVGYAGANITWNLDTLVTHSTDTVFTSPCDASPHCAVFPGTTVYMHYSADAQSTYYNCTSTALSLVGQYSDTSIGYSDYEDILRYPFTYNSHFTDTFSSIFTTTAGYTYLRHGTATVKGDGWGTLILPGGTYPSTLRVWTIEDFDDSTMGPASSYVWHYEVVSFTWYLQGQHTELLSQSKVYRNSEFIQASSYYTRYGTTDVADVNMNGIEIQLLPNPANGQVTIHSGQRFEDGASAELYSAEGRLAGKYQLHGTDVAIRVADLAPGMYLCRIYSPTQATQVKKLIVAH